MLEKKEISSSIDQKCLHANIPLSSAFTSSATTVCPRIPAASVAAVARRFIMTAGSTPEARASAKKLAMPRVGV